MIDTLPNHFQKDILQPKTQSTIQKQITQETINLLAPCIANLRKAVNETVVQMQSNAEDKFNQFENDA
ncbi:hypothetical protein J4710_06695 [Staphylococcus xylosus]|uniref:Uncharacterized protein n=1 Tax=Staphylococcus xylosus TaxID=1288 RepID=A0A939NC68_STAXY|nr:hypothetical protein [Staphylococcus xylosus]